VVFCFFFAAFFVCGQQSDQIGRTFCPMGDSFLWVLFLKIAEAAHIFGYIFSMVMVMQYFDKNALGYILGNIFHKLIWSPWRSGKEVLERDVPALNDCVHLSIYLFMPPTPVFQNVVLFETIVSAI
jgi:hypothetical protein